MAAADTIASMELEMWTLANDSQRYRLKARSGVNNTALTAMTFYEGTVDRAFDIGGSYFCRVRAQLGNTADTLTIKTCRIYGDKGGFV